MKCVQCIWVKFNDINKVRDLASAEGFAGYSAFQNLIAGGQTPDGRDATNELSYVCLEAADALQIKQPVMVVTI